MGYRSEVVLAVGKELMPHFLNVLAKEPDARAFVFKDNDCLREDYNGEGTLLVSWSDVKWYKETYAPITAIQHFIDMCDSDGIEGLEEPWEHFRFVRLGEDSDDIEEKGYLNSWDIYITRNISF